MSFCVDLWNGFETIKEKFTITHRQIKHFNKLINAYINFEKEYCKNLDSLYKEYKDTGDTIYPLEQSRLNIIEMINSESKLRKIFINKVNKEIIEKINKYLTEPKISLDNHFLEADEKKILFNKLLNKLANKQEFFHSQCKELSSNLSQKELENTNSKENKLDQSKIQKIYSKVINSRNEYLFYINETNIERSRYNLNIEEILNELEKVYRKTIEKFKSYLYGFSKERNSLLETLYKKEKTNFDNYHSKIDLELEALLFIEKNATKQFPMIKFEFCPLKHNVLSKFIKSKYHDKLNEKDLSRVLNSIENFFQKNELFPDNLIQSGVSKSSLKKSNDFFSSIIFTKTKDKNNDNDSLNKSNIIEEQLKDKNPNELEVITMNNINFIKNFINELITDNKVKMFEIKIYNDENIFKLDKNKDKKESMDKIKKREELINLINIEIGRNPVYIETLIKSLSFIRSKGFFKISQESYELLQVLFKLILQQNPKDDYMLKNILILAQTFFIIKDNEKIYLQNGLKGNEVLNRPETWHRCINYTLNLANSEKDLTNQPRKEDFINKINKEAFNTVVSYLCDMKQFTDDEIVFTKVKDYYVEVYNLDKKMVDESIEEYMKDLIKKKEKEKLKIQSTNNPDVQSLDKTNEAEAKEKNSEKENNDERGEMKTEEKKAGEETPVSDNDINSDIKIKMNLNENINNEHENLEEVNGL